MSEEVKMGNFFRLVMSCSLGLVLLACDYNKPEDYDAQAEYRAFIDRQAKQLEAQDELAEEVDPAIAELAEGHRLFGLYCAACHGPDGRAGTPTAQALRPIPRNFADASWQAQVSDEHIATVIRDGGPAVGLAATMTPWGGTLSEEQIELLVRVVREMGN